MLHMELTDRVNARISGATHREIARRAEESGTRESDLIRLARMFGLKQLAEHEPARIALMAQRTRLTSELDGLYEMSIVGGGEDPAAPAQRAYVRATQEWGRDFNAIQAAFAKLASSMGQLEAQRDELPVANQKKRSGLLEALEKQKVV